MSQIELELLKRRIIDRYDPDYLVDVLRISTEDLVEAFADRLPHTDFTELEDEDEDETD